MYKVSIPGVDQIGLDTLVLLFTIALTCVTAFLCGLAPALGSSRPDLNQALKEGGRSSSSGFRTGRVRNMLVISEVALALMLLIGAALMIESFGRLRETHLGFNPHNVLTMGLTLAESKYPEKSQRVDFYQQLLQRVGALPGVKSAALAQYLPLSGHWGTAQFTIEGQPPLARGDFLVADVDTVSASYFRTMEIPLVQGRNFTDADRENAPQVVIINEAMAQNFWPNKSPVGQRLNFGNAEKPDFWEVIGVVGDVKHFGQDTAARPKIFSSHLQDAGKWTGLVVRSAGNPIGLLASIRNEVLAIDKAQPVFEIQTLEQLVSQTIAPRRFVMLLLGIFAVIALLLATIGIYGVIAYSVSKRTHEIGVRMALGAQGTDVLRLVLRQGMILTLIGLAVGLAGSIAVSRLIANQLYQVEATDPLIYTIVPSVIAVVALIACAIPAHRATKVHPMEALRYE
jgi:predicted permease